jgi:hypothetical protein
MAGQFFFIAVPDAKDLIHSAGVTSLEASRESESVIMHLDTVNC